MGRRKGSKNKPKNIVNNQEVSVTLPEIPRIQQQVNKIINLDSNSFNIETKTIRGTPVIIMSICGSSVNNVKMFLVIAHPHKNAYKTMAISNSLIKPESFSSLKVKKEFETFQWGKTKESSNETR